MASADTMRPKRRISLMRNSRIATLVAFGLGLASVATAADATPAKVEFAEVEGLPCLQPRLLSADVVRDDFSQAESRWLSEHYPDRPVPRWKSVLNLLSEPVGSTATPDSIIVSETAFVQAADGSEIPVCFTIGIRSSKQ